MGTTLHKVMDHIKQFMKLDFVNDVDPILYTDHVNKLTSRFYFYKSVAFEVLENNLC